MSGKKFLKKFYKISTQMSKKKYKYLIKQKQIKPITCLTAYTKSIAKILDGKVDIILVGDSLGTALYGMNNTQGVTLKMMKEHGKAVNQNVKKSLTIVDMPYNTYKNKYEALKNAKDLISYTKIKFIKIETDNNNINIVKHLIKNKINLVGHIGVTPQKFKNFKNIKSVGKNDRESKSLISLALKLEKLGIKLIILECVKTLVAKKITDNLKIPTIGIGSSKFCDGQVLVINDLLNLDNISFKPRFVKSYLNLEKIISIAVKQFAKEVKKNKFPTKKHSY